MGDQPGRISVNINYGTFSAQLKPMRALVKEIYDIAVGGDVEKAAQMIYAQDNADQIIEMMNDIKDINDEQKTKTITTLKMELKERIKNGFKANQKICDMIKDAVKFAGRNDFDRIKLYIPSDIKTKNPTINDVVNNQDLVILYCAKNKDTVCQKRGFSPSFINNEEKDGKPDLAKLSDKFDGTRFASVYSLEIKQNPNGEYDVRIR